VVAANYRDCVDDYALVAAMVQSDPRGLDGAYRRYAPRLHAYARALLGDRESAADVVHDTFVLASQNANRLRDPQRLRPWLYTIARNEALRQLKHRARTAPLEPTVEPVEEPADPAAALHSEQIAELVRAAMAGLAEGDREIVELSIRHGLPPVDIAAMLRVSVNHAHARLSRARSQMATALGVLLVARRRRGDCPELDEMLRGWDGTLTPLLRKRLNRHIDSCNICSAARREQLNPAALLSGYAALPFAAALSIRTPRPDGVTETTKPAWDHGSGFPLPPGQRRRGRTAAALAAAGVVAIMTGAGTAVFVLGPRDDDRSFAGSPVTPSAVPVGTGPGQPGLADPSPEGTPAQPTPTAAPTTRRPSPSRSAEPPPPPPSLPALTLDTLAEATCESGDFILSVVATTNADLAAGRLTWGSLAVNRTWTMRVSGRTATVSRTVLTTRAKITWWIVLEAKDGRSVQSAMVTSTNPCS
jgi:RNA polymerase sigma factor (sigma-70 family)